MAGVPRVWAHVRAATPDRDHPHLQPLAAGSEVASGCGRLPGSNGVDSMTVTADQAKMLTTLALAIRPHGAPRWDGPGVMAALKRVAHLKLSDVTRAVTRAAEDAGLQTPAPIGIPTSPCWADKVLDDSPVRNVVPRGLRCTVCDNDHERCRRLWTGDHEFARPSPRDVDLSPVVAELKDHVRPTPSESPRGEKEPSNG